MEVHQDSVYRKTMLQALHFTWNHKRLWFLGVFAGLVNSGGVFEVLVRGLKDVMSADFNWGMIAEAIAPGSSLLFFIPDIIAGNNLSAFGGAFLWVFILSLIALSFWFFSLAQGTLLAAVESPGDLPLSKRAHDELPQTGRLVVLNLVTHSALALIMLATYYPYAAVWNKLGNAAATTLGFLIATPLTLGVAIFSILAACGIALRKQSLKESCQKAWNLIKKQPFFLAESALMLFAVSVAGVFALGILLRILTMVWSAWSVATFFVSADSLVGALNALFMLLTTVIVIGGAGFLVTFQYAAWSSLYDQLSLGSLRAALLRHVILPIRSKLAR